MHLPICPHIQCDWLNLRLDDLSDPRVLAAREHFGCMRRYYAINNGLIAVMAALLAVSVLSWRIRSAVAIAVAGSCSCSPWTACFGAPAKSGSSRVLVTCF